MERAIIILAAGDGKRMQSSMPKALHRLGGKPMLAWVMDAARLTGDVRCVVVTAGGDNQVADFVKAYNAENGCAVEVAVQEKPLGTGHAVESAAGALEGFDGVGLVTFADTPLVKPATMKEIIDKTGESGAAVCALGFEADDPKGYGRFIIKGGDRLEGIIEEEDATPAQRKITLVNAGVMALSVPLCFELLASIGSDNQKGEKYLTDIVAAARAAKHDVITLTASADEVMGVNSRAGLAAAEAALQDELRVAAMAGGATLIAPETVFLSHDTVLEADVIVEPHVVFGHNVRIGSGSEVRAFSHVEGVTTGACCIIGPYARIRPGTELGEGARIGNFVETKNAKIGALAKASHLSYIGDSIVGDEANIGAGTITCNFDGVDKHETRIGKGAFIGSNTALVAPVSVGERAIVGAGSTITADVPDDGLTLTRAERRDSKSGASGFRKARSRGKDKDKKA